MSKAISLRTRLREKMDKKGRKAFITHIDGQKLAGKDYETTIWVYQDTEQFIKMVEAEFEKLENVAKQNADSCQMLSKKLEQVISEFRAKEAEAGRAVCEFYDLLNKAYHDSFTKPTLETRTAELLELRSAYLKVMEQFEVTKETPKK